jgi:hypothetical protein
MNALSVLVVLAFIAAAGFPITYVFYPWFRTPAGRSVMGLALVIAFTLGLSVWRLFFGSAPDVIRIPVYALVVLALWAQWIVLLLAPLLNRRRLARLARIRPPIPPEVAPMNTPHGPTL